jgi:hypothetical protein
MFENGRLTRVRAALRERFLVFGLHNNRIKNRFSFSKRRRLIHLECINRLYFRGIGTPYPLSILCRSLEIRTCTGIATPKSNIKITIIEFSAEEPGLAKFYLRTCQSLWGTLIF